MDLNQHIPGISTWLGLMSDRPCTYKLGEWQGYEVFIKPASNNHKGGESHGIMSLVRET